MTAKDDIKRYRENYRTEQEAAALYLRLAAAEKNPRLASVYERLAETEKKHAAFWEDKLAQAGVKPPDAGVSLRTRTLGWLAGRLGSPALLPAVALQERNAVTEYDQQEDARSANMPAEERSHARIFSYMALNAQGLAGSDLARFEGRYRSAGGNALRAAVLGANDGLVSVFCLVMGVAGAGMPPRQILLTGLAGLLAGALSMALGEWLSVQSSRELYTRQIGIEKNELAEVPEEEKEELALIYQAKGIDPDTARTLADRLVSNPETALDTLAREELGIDPEDLGGSAWEAALTSFLLFTAGAIPPVLPFVFLSGTAGIAASAAASALGLFAVGAAITFMTGRGVIFSGLRQVAFGLATAGATFGIGHLIGVSVAG